ncbi:MAG TPA: hypothetical protein VH253_10965 [Phycisphaerae bacterium]|nr:hypothetical protein [Phycisphaerae bacterium]
MIDVGEMFVHEAGHAVATLQLGGEVVYAWAGAAGGTTLASRPPSPFAHLVVLAAGEAAGRVKAPYRIPGNPPPPPPPTYKANASSDPTRSALAELHARIEEVSDIPVMSDRERLAEALVALVAEGRIKRRPDMEWRWWMRARRAAQRILAHHHRTLASFASELARKGGLSGAEVQELWLRRWPVESRFADTGALR